MNERLSRLEQRWRDSPLNPIRLGVIVIVLMIAFMVSGMSVQYPSVLLLAFNVLIIDFVLYGILLMGLNLQYGYAGLVNFGPVLFFAVGAYTTALFTAESTFNDIGMGMSWIVGLVAALLVTLVVAIVVGLSTIQLRDDYLAVVTLAAAEIFHRVTISASGFFGGEVGISGIPTIIHELSDDRLTVGLGSFVILGSVLAISYGIVSRLGESPFGRVLRGIRDDEEAVSSLGKNVLSYKFRTFIIGSLLMGLAGAFLALENGAIAPSYISIDVTVLVWIGMLIGGAGNHRAVLGGLLIVSSFQLATRFGTDLLPVTSATFASLRLIAVGLLLIVIIRYRPQGLWGDAQRLDVET